MNTRSHFVKAVDAPMASQTFQRRGSSCGPIDVFNRVLNPKNTSGTGITLQEHAGSSAWVLGVSSVIAVPKAWKPGPHEELHVRPT